MRLVCGLMLASCALPASARWYQVDVVVFEHTSGSSEEQFSPLEELPDFSAVTELLTAQDRAPQPEPDNGTSNPVAFKQLRPAARKLGGVARRLRGAGAYRVLLNGAWRQPSYGVRRARRVYLSDQPSLTAATGGDDGLSMPVSRQVEGIVSLKVARLLHIEVDFLYYHDGQPVRLRETRKLKFRELHYFDHPLFGVIVQVTPYVLPSAPETVSVGEDEPPNEPVSPASEMPQSSASETL